MQVALAKVVCTVLISELPRGALVASVRSLLDTLRHLVSHKEAHPTLCAKLEDLDFGFQFQVVEAFLTDLEKQRSVQPDVAKSIDIALGGLHETIGKIHAELAAVSKLVEEHSQKWFAYFRSIDFQLHVDNMQQHKRVFDLRFALLREIVLCLH